MTESETPIIPDHLKTWFNARWAPSMGAIDGYDVTFLGMLIASEQPRRVVEIGCASGLSSVILSTLLQAQGGGTLDSFDLLDRFYADPQKPVGYLLKESPDCPDVQVNVHPGTMSLDVKDHVEGGIDFCFIDAAHKHPWPLIDTLAVLPLMRAGGVIVHHDLQMFKNPVTCATGPKVLSDQIPRKLAIRPGQLGSEALTKGLKTRSVHNNIFALRVPEDVTHLSRTLAQGFHLGWDRDPQKRVPEQFADRFSALLKSTYAPDVAQSFEFGLSRYNPDVPRQGVRQSVGRIVRRFR
ncbi:MAG: class I SAM-dependent methyltransferase [Paracoccaceae bacterium]